MNTDDSNDSGSTATLPNPMADYEAVVSDLKRRAILPDEGGSFNLHYTSLAAVVWAEIAGLDELARKLRSPAVTLVDALVAHELEAGAKRLRRALVAEGAES